MTSTNDGKEVKSNQTSGQKGKTYFIELYKSLEARLSGECTGEQRARLVCEAWRRVHSLCQHSAPTTHPHLLVWLQRHTAHTILQTEWQSPKSKEQHTWLDEAIGVFIGECQEAISKRDGSSSQWESQLLHRAQWFRNVLPNPWGHSVLKALLDSRGTQPTDEEVLSWLKEERGVMFVTRLRQLAASKCDDLALLLAGAVMGRVRACSAAASDADQLDDRRDQPEPTQAEPTFANILRRDAGFTIDVWELLTDIEFVLLHKGELRSRCIELAKQTPLRNGYQLVERLYSRLEMSPRDKKLWKNAKEVSTLIAQVVIARCMVVPQCAGACRAALYGCARSLARQSPAAQLRASAAALAAPAATARHLHTLAAAVHAECKEDSKSFVCELYVRAITAGMNELERLKIKTEKETEARTTEQTLSTWFIQLGSLLSDSSRMSHECLLTAFSVHPSPLMYERVKTAAPLAPLHKDIHEPGPETNSEFGSWATDSRTQTNLVKTSETLNIKQIQKHANVLSTAIFTEGEALGLCTELCQDLAVLISGPRVKTLSWDMERETLLENCRAYMDRTHGGTRALTTELKYLNLDLRSYQHLPEEEEDENDAFYGIEKGYEHLVENQEPDIWEDTLFNDSEQSGDDSTTESTIVIPRRKKKTKRLKYSSDEETDPLSLESDKTVKKERRHKDKSLSKERNHSKEKPYSKERNHSKDKPHSKERKNKKDKQKTKYISTDPLADPATEGEKSKKEKKKERKERKKKEKVDGKELAKQKPTHSGALSRLIGMKVARIPDVKEISNRNIINTNLNNNLCVTDSDYDSQGKSSLTSLNSEGNDPDVLFDGLFSMDELRPPEKCTETIQRTYPPKHDELRVANGVIVNNTLGAPKVQNMPILNQRVQSIIQRNDVRSQVKKSIKKLIEFRRNKAINEDAEKFELSLKHNQPLNSFQTSNENTYPYKPITEENVIASSAPKIFLNADKVKQLNSLKDEVNSFLKKCGSKGNVIDNKTIKSPVRKTVTNKILNAKILHNSSEQLPKTIKGYQRQANQNTFHLEQQPQNLINNSYKNCETPSQEQYKEFLKQRESSSKGSHLISSKIENPNQNIVQNMVINPTNQDIRTKSSQSNFNLICQENIEQDYQQLNKKVYNNINQKHFSQEAATQRLNPINNTNNLPRKIMFNESVSPSQNQYEKFLKELQESINAGATKDKLDNKASVIDMQGLKQTVPQKKPDSAPKTFSRLSYLHKNKQSDSKSKVPIDQTKTLQNMPSKDTQHIDGYIDQATHLKSRDDNLTSRIDKPIAIANEVPSSTKMIVQTVQNFKCLPSTKNTPLCLNRQYPAISNALSSPILSNVISEEIENKIIQQKNCIAPTSTGYLSEIDQKELLYLLRQQSKMHPLKNQQITDIAKNPVERVTINVNVQANPKSNNTQCLDLKVDKSNASISETTAPANLTSAVKVSKEKASSSGSELKKVRNVKSKSISKQQTVKTKEKSDWESVMNALLAQKTPSRGPNALDIFLKKDSFEKRSANNHTEPLNVKVNANKNIETNSKHTKLKPCCTTQSNKPCSASVISTGTVLSLDSKQKQDKKLNQREKHTEISSKIPLNFNEKPLIDIIQNDDPFISGIPNSDYDLIEELMDDDLRKEIELMSDEEVYNTITVSPKEKKDNSFVNNYAHYKTNPMPINQSQSFEPCRNMDVSLNKNLIVSQKPILDLQCNEIIQQPIIQNNLKSCQPVSNISNIKPRIISNELIMPTLKQCPNINMRKRADSTKQTENNSFHVNNACSNQSTVKNIGNDEVNAFLNLKTTPKVNDASTPKTKNILDPARVVLTVPQKKAATNVMVIGNELIFDPFTTIQISKTPTNENVINYDKNTYVALNQTPNLTLYRTSQMATPCVTPIVIEKSIALPIIQRVVPNMSMDLISNLPNTKKVETPENITSFKLPHEDHKLNTEPIQHNRQMKSNENLSANLFTKSPTSENCTNSGSTTSIEKEEIVNKVEIVSNILIKVPETSNTKILEPKIEKSHKDFNTKDNANTLKQPITNFNTKLKSWKVKDKTETNKFPEKLEKEKNVTNSRKTKKNSKNIESEIGTDSISDKERIELKRKRILNRQISHRCFAETIALPYESLKTIKKRNHVKKSQSKHNKKGKKCNFDKNKINVEAKNISNSKTNSGELQKKSISVIYKKPKTLSDKSCKKNNLISPSRILLRSSKSSPMVYSETHNKQNIMTTGTINSQVKSVNNDSRPSNNNINHRSHNTSIIKDNNTIKENLVKEIDIEKQIISSVISNNNKELVNLLSNNINDNEVEASQNKSTCVKTSSMNTNSDNSTSQSDSNIHECTNNFESKKRDVLVFDHTNSVSVSDDSSMLSTGIINSHSMNKEKADKDKSVNHSIPLYCHKVVHNAVDNKMTHSAELNNVTNTSKRSYVSSHKNITFEELPDHTNDPLKKIVRIKLPSGTTFKATISGKLNTNVDTIFDDPTIKALLWKNMNNNTKCTLNIKQVAIKTPTQSHTVMTHVHDISYPSPRINLDTETIDLVSDDEETPNQHFQTEFGNFGTALMNLDIFTKHQKRLSEKCFVKMERLPFTKNIIAQCKSNVDDTVISNTRTLHVNEDIIEIDDSSNDSAMTSFIANNPLPKKDVNLLAENVGVLKDLLIKELGVVGNPINDNELVNENVEKILTDKTPILEGIKKNNAEERLLKNQKCKDILEKNKMKKCFISLVRCDNPCKEDKRDLIVKKSLTIEPVVVPNDLKKVATDIEDNLHSTLRRSGSLSILTDFSVSNEKCYSQNSPYLIDNFEISESSNNISRCDSYSDVKPITSNICSTDWLMTKFDLHRYYNVLYIDIKTFYKTEKEKQIIEDVSTDCDSDNESNSLLNTNNNNTFDSEISYLNQVQVEHQVPNFSKIVLNYIVNNYNLIVNLKSVQSRTANTTLKRKLYEIGNNKSRHKIYKKESNTEERVQLSTEGNNCMPQISYKAVENTFDKMVPETSQSRGQNGSENLNLKNCTKDFIQSVITDKASNLPTALTKNNIYLEVQTDGFSENENTRAYNLSNIKQELKLSMDIENKDYKIKKDTFNTTVKNDCYNNQKHNSESDELVLESNLNTNEHCGYVSESNIVENTSDTIKTATDSYLALRTCSNSDNISSQSIDKTSQTNGLNELKEIIENNEFGTKSMVNLEESKLKPLPILADGDLKVKDISKNTNNILVKSSIDDEYSFIQTTENCEQIYQPEDIAKEEQLPKRRNQNFIKAADLDNISVNSNNDFKDKEIYLKNTEIHLTSLLENNITEKFEEHVKLLPVINKMIDKANLNSGGSKAINYTAILNKEIGPEDNSLWNNEKSELSSIILNNDQTIEEIRSNNSIVDIDEINDSKNIKEIMPSRSIEGNKYSKPLLINATNIENYQSLETSGNFDENVITTVSTKSNSGVVIEKPLELYTQKNNDIEIIKTKQQLSYNKTPDDEFHGILQNNKETTNNEQILVDSIESKIFKNESCSKLQTKSMANENALHKNVTLVYNVDSNVVLEGSLYEDPVVGKCYIFPIAKIGSLTDAINLNKISSDNPVNLNNSFKNRGFEDQPIAYGEKENSNLFNVIIPKITYSRKKCHNSQQPIAAKDFERKNLKRKSNNLDNKFCEKRYRKGKNIDYPKRKVTVMSKFSYSKEYKNLFSYCSSIKFSFSRPFHKEFIDVSNVLKSWPIQSTNTAITDQTEYDSKLFTEINEEKKSFYDPLEQSFAEEISTEYIEPQSSCDQINENNFNMGFGERSDRVIKISEDENDISKFSAATLSDVKRSQPFLLSEDYEDCDNNKLVNSKQHQIEMCQRFISLIKLKDKVRSVFRKTTLELNYNCLKYNKKDKYMTSKNKNDIFLPDDLLCPDFFEPSPIDYVVQVVQVGQLPVSTAAQNPVTCDPRVTQVTDASPPRMDSSLDDSQSSVKTEYTELTTADLSLPLIQEYERHIKSKESTTVTICNENITVEMEVTEIKTEEEVVIKDEPLEYNEDEYQPVVNNQVNNFEYRYVSSNNLSNNQNDPNTGIIYEHFDNQNREFQEQQIEENNSVDSSSPTTQTISGSNIISSSVPNTNLNSSVSLTHESNIISKPAVNTMSIQQALAQALPPVVSQTTQVNDQPSKPLATPQVLHIVQGKNINRNHITLIENTQNSVSSTNTPVLHIVQNKGINTNSGANPNVQHATTYSGLPVVDAKLQQRNNNQLLHIVNTSNQKNPSATGQLLKRVNLLTNVTNAQGSNEQKMVQFLCKSTDGKSIQLNAPHQRSMVLRLQPIETSNVQGSQDTTDGQDSNSLSNANMTSTKELVNVQNEIKSRSVYEENYAKFIQSSSNNKSMPEKATSLPKFNQAFGKQGYQENIQKNELESNTSNLSNVNINLSESSEGQSSNNAMNLDHIPRTSSPPLLVRKPSILTSTQSAPAHSNLMHQIKQTITPMNIQTMHGGVIYTRQIPVNIGGGQTINLITVPSTELMEESNQKHHNNLKFVNQGDLESPIIKIVPQSQTSTENTAAENINHNNISNDSSQNQHQPVLTQMRIKLPMLSKAPQMVSGTRVVRPSFFQIQRNVIGGTNQPVYQQLLLTAAPPLGQHTIRLPQSNTTRNVKVSLESQASPESQMSSSTLEQLREFDMVLEQVKERSTVQPNAKVSSTYKKVQSSDIIDSTSITSTVTESTQQILYSMGSNQPLNVAYVSKKSKMTPTHTQSFVRSPDSSGIIDSPPSLSSTTYVQIPQTTITNDMIASEESTNHVLTSQESMSHESTSQATTNQASTDEGLTSEETTEQEPISQALTIEASTSQSSSSQTATNEDSPCQASSSQTLTSPESTCNASTSQTSTTQPNQSSQPKAAKIGSKSKSRPKSSNPSNTVKVNSVPPKTSSQKPLEDEQTTQRILYILAEYKEQVENSPDKDKPAPRRRSNPPINPPGSSKRKKSSSGSRRPGTREMSPIHCDETCRTMGSEDSSCGASQGDCNESCTDSHSPQQSPRKVVRKISFENEPTQARPLTHRNVIVADGQTITVARGTAGKPTTAVLMPANYILPVSMVKSGQQIAIVTNRGPKLITVGGESGNAVLLQRVVGPAGLKPVLTRPGVRHVRLPAAALHNLQAFNLATATTVQPPDSTASPGSIPTPPDLVDCRASKSPWNDGEAAEVKPEPESSPDEPEPWNVATSSDPNDYLYEETVRTDNMNRTVLDAIPDRYSPEMEAQRIFDKMFDVETKKSYVVDSQDSPRCDYDIDTSDGDDKPFRQVVKRRVGAAQRKRLTHAAALRQKYAILEQELRLQGKAFLQKSLSEECEDLGVDSPSASELFPEAELLFSNSPAQDNQNPQNSQIPQPAPQLAIPRPDVEDESASDAPARDHDEDDRQDLGASLGLDEGVVAVDEDGARVTITLDQEEFARSHPNTTFHSEPSEDGEVQQFTIAGLKGRHITSTIFHAGRAPATVLVSAPQTTVISQATNDNAIHHNVKYANINQIINASHGTINLPSVLVKDDRLTKFDNILTDSRELHLSNTASAVIHSTGNATQVIRRVCYDDEKRETRYILDEPEGLIAGDDAKMVAEENSRDAALESIADDENSSSERHAELFWESNSASERSDGRRPLDFSSDSEKCCKSPSYDENNSTDSSVGIHMRLDSVIKDARGLDRSGSADGSSADDTHPPLRTYPAKRIYHSHGDVERSLSGKTRACPEERTERPDDGPERPDDGAEGRRRASGRGVVKRGCHCCSGSPQPSRPKKPRHRKPNMDFTN